MTNIISGYYCNDCGQSHLSGLATGCLTGIDQTKYLTRHSMTKPKKEVNGVFYDTRPLTYQQRGNQIGLSGFVEVEADGNVNAYYRYTTSIAEMQYSGIASGDSSLGKAVLLNYPESCHWYPATGYSLASGNCSRCGTGLF